MSSRLKRIAAGVAAGALLATVAPLLTATPAFAAGVPQTPGATVKTPGGAADFISGNSSNSFTLRLPAGASCPGDTAGGEYFIQSYIVPSAVDPSTLQFDSNGPVPNGLGAAMRNPMYTPTGQPYVDQPTDLAGTPGGPGPIINIPDFSFAVYGPGDIPAGSYNVGIACTHGPASATQMGLFWNTTVYVQTNAATGGPAQINWGTSAPPGPPAAPAVTNVAKNDQSLTATFTHTASNPASTYTGTATPQAADADCAGALPVTTAPTATVAPIAFSGVRNTCTYDVTVSANNGVGGPVASASSPGTPNVNALTGLGAAAAPSGVNLSWTAPAGPTTPSGYDVTWTFSPGGTGGPTHVTTTSASIAGLAPGTAYTFTVTPTYNAPPAQYATPVPVNVGPVSPSSNTQIIQHIEVTRPVGALVLTQRCGVHGNLPVWPTATPGFPAGLPAIAPTADQTGTAPYLNWDHTTGTGTNPDPNFSESPTLWNGYPYPQDPATGAVLANYPTSCGINLGVGKLVTSGPGAGNYFAASGFINQVTVVDTRDDDLGWHVTGTASDFTRTSGGSGSFSGNFLGWNEYVASDSAPYDTDLNGTNDYDQIANPGSTVQPTQVVGGMKTGPDLGNALPNQGLGIAVFDARLKLLIPVVNDNGRYEADLTFGLL